jgi:hypothetical protein
MVGGVKGQIDTRKGGDVEVFDGFVWYIYAKHVSSCINLKP